MRGGRDEGAAEAWNDDLYVAGNIEWAGGHESAFIARWNDSPTNVAEIAQPPSRGLRAAPNPFRESVTLGLARGTSGPVAFRIYDIMGRLVTRLEGRMNGDGNAQATLRPDAA